MDLYGKYLLDCKRLRRKNSIFGSLKVHLMKTQLFFIPLCLLNLQVMDEEEHKISWMKKIFIETGQRNQKKYLKEVLKFADCWIC